MKLWEICVIWSIVAVFNVAGSNSPDFQFKDDVVDVQHFYTEPLDIDTPSHHASKASSCPYSEDKILLSLVLRGRTWNEVVQRKRDRAINKLAKFFMVTKDDLNIDDVTKTELYEMSKNSLHRGKNQLASSSKKFGRLEFEIGCGKQLYPTGKLISNQIGHQMKDGSINDISGLDFGWWVIWTKRVNNKTARLRRQAEGSGEVEDDDEDDYYLDYEDGDAESQTNQPISTTTAHPHRHHHGKQTTETTNPTPRATSATPFVEENYDDEYDDEIDENAASPASQPSQSTVTAQTFPTTTQIITQRTTTQEPEPEVRNTPPMLRNRLPKTPVTAGKAFKIAVPEENFYDAEDGTNLNLELLDKNEHVLKSDSWIQFNQKTREIYGLPLEGVVSRWRYILRATDSSNESVQEDLDISVQQHKGHRSVNHEIELQVKLNEKFEHNIDWQLKLMDAITEVLGDSSNQNIVVREIRPHINDLNAWTFVYTNESLPKDTCPELEAEELVEKLHIDDLNRVLGADINVRNVQEVMVGNCKKAVTKPKVSTFAPAKNFPPVLRNQVDRVNATVGQLLVYRVPTDTFYDPEDENDLQLSLLSQDRQKLDPHYWLQFDVRNREFYGIPKPGDFGQREYLLVAKDRGGLTATDALVVVVNHSQKRDYGVLFDFNLGISFDDFNRSTIQRRFIEKVARVFDDSNTNHILVRQIRRIPQTQNVAITFYNTTLHRHHRCPTADIEELRSILLHPDSSIRDRVKDTLSEFHLQSVNLHPIGACQGADTITHEIPVKPDEPPPHQPDDYLLTFVLPAIIILAMLLLASIVACYLHRKRLTGKMELGDEEERKSFRSKGIPVIFQDELDEKPEIATKSPIILKDEKPPLLPPSYNQTNPDDDDMDEYVPPPGVGPIGARETRGKSPVTPSYRKPPPYVSP